MYQLYIELEESKPLVWRRIIVPAEYSLYQLHMAIQGAFGWMNSHLYQFSETGMEDNICYGEPVDDLYTDMPTLDARKTTMNTVLKKKGQTYSYVYDFGDSWTHRIILEKIAGSTLHAPICIEGSGACPPDDVGGIHGYREMLEVFNTPRHPEQAGYIKWLGLVPGEKWDANFCSIREANLRLAMLGAGD